MAEKILVVEDDPAFQDVLVDNLKLQGYDVQAVGDGHTAIEATRAQTPDLVILDIMLPGMNGFDVCKVIRKEMTVPVLMLTALDDEYDRVVGLEAGADDYLTKPFSMRELLARVKAQLRRTQIIREELERIKTGQLHEVLTLGNLSINLTRREVELNGQVLSLRPHEYDLLVYFAKHQGEMISRETILERVWGWDYVDDTRGVDVYVRWLRQKIEPDPSNPVRIVTVRGGGYRFEG